jgi:hypothetical protein
MGGMSTTMPPSPYPVGYEVDFVEQRSRLTTFFRYLLVIPLFIMGFFIAIGAYACVLVAWFAILFTGRYPEGLYNFVSRAVRFGTRVQSYVSLAVDAYPPFDLDEHPEYPVRVPIAPPKESYSRVKTFFRFLIGIPVILINYALGIVANVAGLISWFWIVITGKQNEGLHNAIKLGMAYQARTTAYFALLTEDWPPFSPEGGSALGPGPESSALPPTQATPAATPAPTPPPAETSPPDVTQG